MYDLAYGPRNPHHGTRRNSARTPWADRLPDEVNFPDDTPQRRRWRQEKRNRRRRERERKQYQRG